MAHINSNVMADGSLDGYDISEAGVIYAVPGRLSETRTAQNIKAKFSKKDGKIVSKGSNGDEITLMSNKRS